MRYTLAAGLLAGILATSAHATVIYHFQANPNTATNPKAQVTGGTLELTDAAYRAGRVDMFNNGLDVVHDYRGHSPIQSVGYTFTPGVGPQAYPGRQRFYDNNLPFKASLSIGVNGGLSGILNVQGVSDVAKSKSLANGAWDVYDVGSDYYLDGLCTNSQLCDAGTGNWVLDASTVPGDSASPVPEPPAWALFGLAVTGLFGLRRKQA